jgi:2-dehydropantoate 2-reductase
MEVVRILVFGAGAIGSLLGHRLASAGHQVALIGRLAYVHAVRERGLVLEEGKKTVSPERRRDASKGVTTEDWRDSVVWPMAAESIEGLPAEQRCWDLIVVTVKGYDTSEAAQALAPHVQSGTPMLMVQNGVGGEEMALEVLADAEIISGVVTLSVSVLGAGHICLETTRGGLNLAPTREGRDIRRWVELFAAAGMRTAGYADYRAMKWSKLLLNIQANAIPAILDMTPGAVFARPALFALERAAFLEALAVMRAMGLPPTGFPGYPVNLLVWAMRILPAPLLRAVLGRMVASGRGDKPPSLQMDLAGGRRRSEVLYLNGAVVTHAERVGMDVPVNRMLLRTLMGMVEGSISWDDFRGQPQKLVAAVQAERG